jgi:hypothetical protein
LRDSEVHHLQRIEEAKTRLHAHEAAVAARADEADRLFAEAAAGLEIEVELISLANETQQLENNEDRPELQTSAEAESLHPLDVREFVPADGVELIATHVDVEDFHVNSSELEQSVNEALTSLDSETQVELLISEKSVELVGEVGSVTGLTRGLTSSDAAQRRASLEELTTLDDETAFGLFGSLFDDKSAEVRSAAARALYEFKTDRASAFTRVMREAPAERRRNIAAALDRSGLAAEAIQNLVGEGREKTYDAFSLLFLMAKSGEVQTLLQTIEKHPDVDVRLSVVKLLSFSNQPDIIPAFRRLAVRGSLPTEVRSAVMEAIYQISDKARQDSLSAA